MGTELFLPGGKSPATQASTTESESAKKLFEETTPVRQELFNQILEGLQTGGIQAKIPIIQSALEQSRGAASNALRQTDESLAQSGLSGTPFGERTRQEGRIQSEAGLAQIPTNVVRDFLGVAPGFTSTTQGQAIQGFTAATASEASVRNAQIAAVAQILASSIQAAGAAGAGCWVAAALYGFGSERYYLARSYIYGMWRGPLARLGRYLYSRYGQRAARRPWLVLALGPLFDLAVWRARRRMGVVAWV